jgi:hypothetical protein
VHASHLPQRHRYAPCLRICPQPVFEDYVFALTGSENIPEYVFAVEEGLEMLFPLESLAPSENDDDSTLAGAEDQSHGSLHSRSVVSVTAKKPQTATITRRKFSPPPPDYIASTFGDTSRPRNMMSGQLSPFAPHGQGAAPLSPLPDNRPRLAQVFSMLSVSTPSEAADTTSSANVASHATPAGRRLASAMPIPQQQLHQLSSFAKQALDSDSDSDATDAFSRSLRDTNHSTKSPLPHNYLLESTRYIFTLCFVIH